MEQDLVWTCLVAPQNPTSPRGAKGSMGRALLQIVALHLTLQLLGKYSMDETKHPASTNMLRCLQNCVKVDSLFMGINRINQSSIHSLAVLPHLKRTHPEAPRSTTNLSTWCSGYPLVMNTLQLNITILLESIIYKWAMASAMLNYPFRTCTYFKSV